MSKFVDIAAHYIAPAAVAKPGKVRRSFDVEGNGLLDIANKIHCIVVADLDSDQVDEYGPDQIDAALEHLTRADYLAGHNICAYDLPLLRRLHNWTPAPGCIIVDTLVISRLILPNIRDLDTQAAAAGDPSLDKLRGRHSLEAWGLRLGIPKTGTDIEDWSTWTPEMQERCVGDANICKALSHFLQPDGYSQQAIEMEHRAAAVCNQITADGVPFDSAAAERLQEKWSARRAELAAQLAQQFPGTTNLNSRQQIGALLESRGWIPEKRTAKTNRPKIDDELLENIPKTYPEFTGLAEYFTLVRRLGQLAGGKKAWLKHVGEDGRIHGAIVHIGTPHSRAAHFDPNLAQVPNPKRGKPLASECRALFRHPGDWVFVACDQAGLQDRCFSHYLAAFDNGAYGRSFVAGVDTHWQSAIALKLVSSDIERDKASKLHTALREGSKSFRYGFLFGMRARRSGEIIAAIIRAAQQIDPDYRGPPANGEQALRRFEAATPGLKQLREKLEAQAARNEWVLGLDGRRVPTGAQYKALNRIVTSAEAIVCKRWLIKVYDELHARFRYGWDGDVVITAWIHDELVCCCRPAIAKEVGEIMVRHAKEPGKYYGLAVPLDAEYQIGRSWAGEPAADVAQERKAEAVNENTETACAKTNGADRHEHPRSDTYYYKDASGTPYLRVERTPAKDFFQCHLEKDRWIAGAPAGPKIPYRLFELLAAKPDEPVWITEGEKDADNVAALGLVATCNSGGAGNWDANLNQHFAGRQTVYLLQDNDAAGRKHTAKIADALHDIVTSIYVVAFPELPEHGDVSDFLAMGGTQAQLLERAKTAKANGASHPGERQGPVDVEERLSAMRFGDSDDGINNTLLSCTASDICRGENVESIVPARLAAVQAYAAAHPEECREWPSVINGDWRDEEHTIASMCFRFINKNPDKAPMLPNYLHEDWSRQLNAGNLPQIRYDRQRKQWFVESAPPRAEAPNGAARQKKARFRLIPFRDMRPGPDPTCVVEDLIPLHGIVVVWGKPKCLKTFWLYDLCFYVARGLPYRGRGVQQGSVVYCAFEGAHGFGARTEALRRQYELPDEIDVPIYLVPGRADLIKEHGQLVVAIRDEMAGKPHPRIVVLDTLNKSLVGSENKPEDMAGYIRAAEAIREAFDCVVIIVHHCGWDEAHPRGHSSLPGAVDAELSVTRTDKLVTVTVQLMKDGPEGVEIRSEVATVDVGADKNGKVLTSLIVLPAEMPAGVAVKGGRPEKNMPVFLRAMHAALLASGFSFEPAGRVQPIRAVPQDEVRKLFYRWFADGEATAEGATAAKQKAFIRCIGAAVAGGTVVKDEDAKGRAVLFFTTAGN